MAGPQKGGVMYITQREILDGVLGALPCAHAVSIGEDINNPYSVKVHVTLKRWTWIALGLLHLWARRKLELMFVHQGTAGVFYQVTVR